MAVRTCLAAVFGVGGDGPDGEVVGGQGGPGPALHGPVADEPNLVVRTPPAVVGRALLAPCRHTAARAAINRTQPPLRRIWEN